MNCGAPITIRASGSSITAACAACGAVLDVANPDVRLIAGAAERTRTPLIPIGARGRLLGTEWQAVGYQVRSSGAGSWQWEEWLLWNPYQGFRFLAQDHGHWTLYAMLRRDMSDDWATQGVGYTAQEPVVAKVEYVLGEFYWRVKLGDQVDVREFARAPFILSEERNGTEVTWSRGVYVEPGSVQAAFKLDAMPPRSGRAPHQPTVADPSGWSRWAVAAAACLLLVVLQSLPFGTSRNRVVLTQAFEPTAQDRGRALSSPTFAVPDRGGTLTLEVSAVGGENVNALELALAVVAVGGADQRYDAPLLIGSEGGRLDATVTLASVPGGSFKLLATPATYYDGSPTIDNPGVGGTALKPRATVPVPMVPFTVTVRRHVPGTGYFWFALLAVILWPVCVSGLNWFHRVQDGTG